MLNFFLANIKLKYTLLSRFDFRWIYKWVYIYPEIAGLWLWYVNLGLKSYTVKDTTLTNRNFFGQNQTIVISPYLKERNSSLNENNLFQKISNNLSLNYKWLNEIYLIYIIEGSINKTRTFYSYNASFYI